MATLTQIIVIITSIISILAFRSEKLIDALIFWPPAINKGQYYRFVTCGLIHANFMHLLFNMVALYSFGLGTETYYAGMLGLQKYYFLTLYISALVVSSVPSYFQHRHDENYRSLGASGAVSAVVFAFILMSPWARLGIFFIPMPAIVYAVAFLAYSVYMSRRGGDGINHDAHLWGAVYGVLFTIAARPGVIEIFLNQLKSPHFR